jgi:hypothetical protein
MIVEQNWWINPRGGEGGAGVTRDRLSLCSVTKLKVCSDRRPRILYYHIRDSDHEVQPTGDSHQIMPCFVQTVTEIIKRFPAPEWIQVKVHCLNARNSRESNHDKVGKLGLTVFGQSRYGLFYVSIHFLVDLGKSSQFVSDETIPYS